MRQKILSEKQSEFWRNCNSRWNVKTGATRSGKTYMDYFLIPRRILAVKGEEGMNVILGNTRETIRRNVILPMQQIYGVKRVSNIRVDNSCRMFGEQVFVLGADNANHVDRIRGMSLKYCYGDEVTTWNSEVFNMLKSRLDKSYSRFDGTCNPESPSHWFKEFLDSDADIYQQAYTIDDNPFLSPVFVENLKREYEGTVYYDRFILGKWALAEGLIYPNYRDCIGEKPKDAQVSDYVLSVDYGTLNAFATILWEKAGQKWYATDEYYYSGRETGQQKTDEDYAKDLDKFIAGIWEERKKREPRQKIRVIVDPSAASFITLLRRREWAKVVPADNSVLDGIRDTAVCMQNGKITVSSKLANWRKEVDGYRWDESAQDDRPVKEHDHAMDAMRYFVKTMNLARVRREII